MKKVFKIVSVVIVLTLLMTGCSVTGIKGASVKSQAIEYLCKKYDAEPEEFELVDYRKPQVWFEEYMYFFQKPILVDYAFEFKYNGRNFFVNREDEEFYDDYQLEDVEKWCTEWLQQNVDEKITGFDIDILDILCYQNTTNMNYDYVIAKGDSEKFLKEMSKNDKKEYCLIYYYDSTINEFIKQDTKNNDVALKLNNIFNSNDKFRALSTSSDIVFTMYKTNVKKWMKVCE